LKFSTDDIVAVMETATKDNAARFHIRGRLFDGTVIEGEDIVGIVGYGGGTLDSRRSFDTPFAKTEMPYAEPVLPNVFALYQNVPNPFNPTTSIRFDVPAGGGIVSLRVYDVSGRLVRTLVGGPQTAGQKTVTWDGRNAAGNTVAAGAYLYRLTAPGFEQTRKMILIK
jgi:hypothetical protein